MKHASRGNAPPRKPGRAAIWAFSALLLSRGYADAELSAREKWLAALALSSPMWSRAGLLDALLNNTKLATRAQAIGLLGPPNYSADLYSPGKGLTARIDEYRLSAANDQTLRLDSDPNGQMKREPSIESEGCACPACRRAMNSKRAELSDETVARYLTTLGAAPQEPRPLGGVESAVGATGWRQSDEGVFGQRTYMGVTVLWRIAGDTHRFFTVSGRILRRDYRTDADLPVSDFAVVTVSDACLAP